MAADKKRLREPKAKPGELVMKWGKIRYELATKKPDQFAKEPFSNMLPSFLEKLEARGCDLTTFKLTVSKKND